MEKKKNTPREEKILATDLNYYILQVKSGKAVQDEKRKKLCNG